MIYLTADEYVKRYGQQEPAPITADMVNGMLENPARFNVPSGYRLAAQIKSHHLNL